MLMAVLSVSLVEVGDAMQDNRRRATRTPIEGEHASGILQVGRDRIPALLVDESAHGIGVVAVHAESICLGTTLTLETAVRHLESRVASVKHITVSGADIYRIGLEWLD